MMLQVAAMRHLTRSLTWLLDTIQSADVPGTTWYHLEEERPSIATIRLAAQHDAETGRAPTQPEDRTMLASDPARDALVNWLVIIINSAPGGIERIEQALHAAAPSPDRSPDREIALRSIDREDDSHGNPTLIVRFAVSAPNL